MAAWLALTALALAGCGDRCEQLCVQTASDVQRCKPEGLDWRDLGARSRADFTNGCRDDWDRTSASLTATEVREALDVCGDTIQTLETLGCDEIAAIYLGVE